MKRKKLIMKTIIFLAIVFFISVPLAKAQIYWWPLPPYNTLWPLWSPVLSLTSNWSTLAPTDTSWLSAVVPVANNTYYASYPQFAPLATPADFLGIPVLIPSLVP